MFQLIYYYRRILKLSKLKNQILIFIKGDGIFGLGMVLTLNLHVICSGNNVIMARNGMALLSFERCKVEFQFSI